MKTKKIRCKKVQIHLKLKLFFEFSDCSSNLDVFFKLKSFSYHVKALEISQFEKSSYDYEDVISKVFKFIKYFINLDKITGSFHQFYDRSREIIRAYKPNKLLLSKLKKIMVNKFCCKLFVEAKDLISKNPDHLHIESCNFSELLPIITIIPLINLHLILRLLNNKRINFSELERLKFSISELTLILDNDHPDLDELQAIRCLHGLKQLVLRIDNYDLWEYKDQNKIANIIIGLPIISLEINITSSWLYESSSNKIIPQFPNNLLIETSYLEKLESLSLGSYCDIKFDSNSGNDFSNKDHNNKIKFAKLKKLKIKCRFEKNNSRLVLDNLVYNYGINLNNLTSFKLYDGLEYIITNKDNIIFNNMKNLTHLKFYTGYYHNKKRATLLNDLYIDNFIKGFYNFTKLEYLNLENLIITNFETFQKGLLILNYLHNLKTFIMNWESIANGDDIDRWGFAQWLQDNLKYNDSLRYLNIGIMPLETENILYKVVNIIKRKYKNIRKLILDIERKRHIYNDIIENCANKKNRLVYLFDLYYV